MRRALSIGLPIATFAVIAAVPDWGKLLNESILKAARAKS
jgi:hypothetical protein